MPTLTFQEFQDTRRWADNLRTVEGIDLSHRGGDEPVPGFYYQGNLHIFAHEGGTIPLVYNLADGNAVEITAKDFELVIANNAWVSTDLAELEVHLYEWGKIEGILE